jgi:hypothetical protein
MSTAESVSIESVPCGSVKFYRQALRNYENMVCNPCTKFPISSTHHDEYLSLRKQVVDGNNPELVELLTRWTLMRSVSYEQMCRLAREAGTTLPTKPGTTIPDESQW